MATADTPWPHHKRAWFVLKRLALAAAIIVGAVLLFRWLLLPGLLAVLQPGDAVATQLRRFGILGSAVLGYWAFVRFSGKRPVRELRPGPKSAALGLLSGAALMALALLPLFALGIYEVTGQRGLQAGLWAVAGFILIAAMLEEIAYRGVLFQALEQAWGTLPAMWLQSLVFALMHIGNVLDIGGSAWDIAATVLSVTLLGALWTLVFVHTRSLWAAGLNHAAWNFTILSSGVPLSGIEDWRAVAPLATEYRGPDWLTGGAFGPENSLVTLGLVALAVFALLKWAGKAGRFKQADTLVYGQKAADIAPEAI